MDLSQLNLAELAEQGAWLTVTHPQTDEDTDLRIRLAGADSRTWQEAERSHTNKRLQQFQRRGNLTMTAEDIEQRGIALLAAATIDWENVVEDGHRIACNVANARQLYRKYTWIREQVDKFVGDRANFSDNAQALAEQSVNGHRQASALDAEAFVEAIEGNSGSGQIGASPSVV